MSTVLDSAFLNTDLSYKIIGKQVVVKKMPYELSYDSLEENEMALQQTVSGKISDSNEEPLPGVSVLVKGTTIGTQADFDGNYSINVSDGAVLVFSYLGMLTQEIEVGSQTTINVILKEDVASLDEVVVVAYGTTTKESITGSVGVVKSETFEQAPVSTFEQALRGSTAGLQATAVDGAPGGNTQVRIRGIGSINASSEPLYVIDGIPIQAGSVGTIDNDGNSTNVMAAINPNDIESISVLKDAASTAIYGSRGANGVILITTKSGKSGKPKITFKALTGFNSQAYNNILKPLNAAQYTELYLEGYINGGDTPAEAQARFDATFQQLIDPTTGEPTDTNWLDAITRTGITQSYDLSASGGTDKLKYFFSGAYFDQENYIIGSGFKRLSARSNVEFKATDYLTVSNNISVSNLTSNTFFDGGSFNNPFKNSLELSPLIPIYDDQGRFNGEHANYFPLGGANPVGSLSGDDLWENKQIRVIDNFAIAITPVKDLTFRSQWNFDLLSLNESRYQNPRYGGGRNAGGSAYEAQTAIRTWVGTQTLNYNKTFGSAHNLALLAGYEAQKTTSELFSASGTQFPNESLRTLNSASAEFAISGSKSEYTFASVFSRANYNYDSKYFLSASIRRDGSSRFAPDNRWGTFYSVGGSWVASNENFLNDISFLDLLKVRSSWGVIGNAGIGNNAYQGFYNYGQDYDGNPGGFPAQIESEQLGWETQENFNIGLDFSVFSKVSGTVEYFKRTSSDLILNVPISRTTGFTNLTQNFGDMTNSGLELSLNVDVINNEDFSWNVGFNTTFLKNEITKLESDFNAGAYRREVGQDFQSFYLFNWAGVNPDNGDPQWYTDATKTTITNDLSEAERFFDGKTATPDFFGGFNTLLTYKGISLSANFIYSYGNYIFDARARGSLADGRLTPRSTATFIYDNRWVPGKTDALAPKFIWGGSPGSGEANNSRWLYDGSYLRLRDLTVAYDFPEEITSKLNLSSIRIFARGTNILTFVKEDILYIDPEQAINGSYTGQTPALKTIALGLDIQL
ncbi:MAG: TonB-dependent receptor [Flavobacteriaceae bacterium]